MKKEVTPWEKVKAEDLQGIRGVCLDIDDTLSTRGKLTAEAYEALWKLRAQGFWVVPITGRPAGWCDHIARFWPVHAVVGENGAFTFYMNQKGVRKRWDTPLGMDVESAMKKLEALAQAILKKFPEAQWASDQAYREFDLAVDIAEDVEPWPSSRIEALMEFCRSQGASVKRSSIHVNTWYGDFDKKKGFLHALEQG